MVICHNVGDRQFHWAGMGRDGGELWAVAKEQHS